MATLAVRIEGNVQGVGFRAHVQGLAHSMQIVGEVWNSSDGAVELICQHENPVVLDKFRSKLESGPGHVLKVEFTEVETETVFDDFAIVWR